jgi:hypothetical protein
MSNSKFLLTERLHEVLSLAMCCETQDPPNPITRAALQHSLQDLIEEIKSRAGGSAAASPSDRANIELPSALPAS